MRSILLTFSGGPFKSYPLRLGTVAVLAPAAILVLVTLAAFGQPSLRDSLIETLGFLPSKGLLQTGLLTHWLVDSTALLACVNACYVLLVGIKLQADLGNAVAFPVLLAGAALGAVGQFFVGPGSPGPIVGASGAVAFWIGCASVPYSLAAPEIAWGSLRLKTLGLRLPFVAVVVAWFLHQGIGLISSDSQASPASHPHAAALAEFGIGLLFGLALRGIKKLLSSDDPDPPEPKSKTKPGVDPLVSAVDLRRRNPELAVQLLRRILKEDHTHVDASLALIDTLASCGDRKGLAEEAVARIAALMRKGRGRAAAKIYEHVREKGAVALVDPRLSATLVSALMDALIKAKATRSAELLGQNWHATHARDPDAWRVREALALLHKDLDT